MANIEILELLMRGAASGAFLGMAALVAREQMSPARLTGALFCVAATAHTLMQMPIIPDALAWASVPVTWVAMMGAGIFWVFAYQLFEDETKLDLRRFIPALFLLAMGVVASLTTGTVQQRFLIAYNLISGGLIAHAVWVVSRGWRGDLVEARRRLRGPILVVAAMYAFVIIAVQMGELFIGSAEKLSPVAAIFLVILSFFGLFAFGRVDPDFFGPATVKRLPENRTSDNSAMSTENTAAAQALDRLMRVDKVYREEGMTVAVLAQRMKLPEHQLRRLINQHLGHRNFSDYLNQWRLGDAKQSLTDPSQREVPISTIALDAGFQSLGPFNRAFKSATGLTPTEFRAQMLPTTGKTSSVTP